MKCLPLTTMVIEPKSKPKLNDWALGTIFVIIFSFLFFKIFVLFADEWKKAQQPEIILNELQMACVLAVSDKQRFREWETQWVYKAFG